MEVRFKGYSFRSGNGTALEKDDKEGKNINDMIWLLCVAREKVWARGRGVNGGTFIEMISTAGSSPLSAYNTLSECAPP